MSGDVHVRFCESLGLKCPGPLTHGHKRAACEKAARKAYGAKAAKKKRRK